MPPSLAVEIDDHAASSHSKNFPRCHTAKTDLSVVDATAIRAFLPTRPDLVIGGPPCQGFSYIGKRNQSDPRNDLLDNFFQLIAALRPRAFMMENVPGLLDSSNAHILDRALNRVASNFTVLTPTVLDASDFGAATRRRRVVVIGYDSTSVDEISLKDVASYHARSVTVQEALLGLPEPGAHDVATIQRCTSDYLNLINRRIKDIGNKERLRGFENCEVSGFMSTKHSASVTDRFANTAQGETEKTSRFFRLHPQQPARTLRAGTGSDRGSFQSARPIHHISPRVISVREAARIQGFPDWFDFHTTKWQSHRMIGNSVNPLFAEAILKTVARALGLASDPEAPPVESAL